MAAQLDPEQWRETVAGYHRAAAEAITRFEGHVAKYFGDGVIAYFGWPAAHDNDAERAARAGLTIVDAIAKVNQQPRHAKLAARVGIDSGAVVVGKGAGQDAEVFGDTPNICGACAGGCGARHCGDYRCDPSAGLWAIRGGPAWRARAERDRAGGPTLPRNPTERSARAARKRGQRRMD
jgi:hypothetical protein